MIAIYAVILFILLLLSGVFSATETAFTSLTLVQINQLQKEKGRRGKVVARLSERPDILLTTLLIGNNLVNIAASALATSITIEYFSNEFIGITTGLLTLYVLIFSEVTPKQIALMNNEKICLAAGTFVLFLSYPLRPFIWVISAISNLFTRLFTSGEKEKVSIENLLFMVQLAKSEGIVESHEHEMVKKIFRINNITAEAILTHRKDVFCLDYSLSIDEAYPLVLKSGFSRIPVYKEHPENIVGIVLIRDLITAHYESPAGKTLKDLMEDPIIIPETKKADDLFMQFLREKLNIAVVIDEYGGLSGIVTREDVVEEILGELYDENELPEQESIRKIGKNLYRIKGDTDFYEIQDKLGLNLPHDKKVLTISGYLTELTQNIPDQGSVIKRQEGTYKILKKSGNTIDEIEFRQNLQSLKSNDEE